MPLRLIKRLCLYAALAVASAWAQTAAVPTAGTTPRIPTTKSSGKAAKPAKTGVPDPDLLDGSAFDKEKRPLEGMLSEIEMGESEGKKGDKISPDSGQSGGPRLPGIGVGVGLPSASPAASSPGVTIGVSVSPPPAGPPSEAGGIKVADLKVPENAQSGGGTQNTSPRDLQIGDAALQIPGQEGSKDVVGVEASAAQQYEKKTPGGGSPSHSNNRNQGVEKGRVVPKGL